MDTDMRHLTRSENGYLGHAVWSRAADCQ